MADRGTVHSLLRARDEAFKGGDSAAHALARSNLAREIKGTKRQYVQRLDSHFTDAKDSRRLWQGFHYITDYKPPSPRMCLSDPLFPDELNTFYARFEAKNTTQAQRLLPAPNSHTLQLTTTRIQKALASINPHKAVGPDNIP